MICGIVLAAGRSRRMGTNKLVLPFAGKTVIAHIVDELLASKVDKIYVVTGFQRKRVIEAISGRSVSFVVNPDRDADMLSSVRCGLGAIGKDCAATLIVLGDQPSLTCGLIDEMIGAFKENPKGIVVPCYGHKRGHPILVSTKYRDEILTRHDNVGLRGILHAHADDIFEMDVSTPNVLSDMDCRADYHREKTSFGNPTRDEHSH